MPALYVNLTYRLPNNVSLVRLAETVRQLCDAQYCFVSMFALGLYRRELSEEEWPFLNELHILCSRDSNTVTITVFASGGTLRKYLQYLVKVKEYLKQLGAVPLSTAVCAASEKLLNTSKLYAAIYFTAKNIDVAAAIEKLQSLGLEHVMIDSFGHCFTMPDLKTTLAVYMGNPSKLTKKTTVVIHYEVEPNTRTHILNTVRSIVAALRECAKTLTVDRVNVYGIRCVNINYCLHTAKT